MKIEDADIKSNWLASSISIFFFFFFFSISFSISRTYPFLSPNPLIHKPPIYPPTHRMHRIVHTRTHACIRRKTSHLKDAILLGSSHKARITPHLDAMHPSQISKLLHTHENCQRRVVPTPNCALHTGIKSTLGPLSLAREEICFPLFTYFVCLPPSFFYILLRLLFFIFYFLFLC